MRDIEIANKVLSVRGLKRKEIKKLKKDGINLGDLKLEQIDDVLDTIFPMVFSKKDVELIEDAAYKESVKVWTAILEETFGSKDEEKNSPKSGAGSQTKKE